MANADITLPYPNEVTQIKTPNIQMVVIVVPNKVDDNIAAMTPVIQNMWLGDLTAASKEYQNIHQSIPKGYTSTFKMGTPIVVTKLEGGNG